MNLTKTRTVQVLGTLGLLILAGLLWLFGLSPQMSKPGDLHSQADSVNSSNAQLQAAIKGLKTQQAHLDDERAYAKDLAARVPATADLPNLFNEIRQAAATAGIPESAISSLTPSVPQGGTGTGSSAGATLPTAGATPGIANMQMNMTVTAPVNQLITFLGQLENMPRAYLISTVNLAPGDTTKGGGSYTVNITGQMFVLPAPTDPSAAPAAASGAATAAPTGGAKAPASKAPATGGSGG